MSIQSPYAITLSVPGHDPIPLVTAGGWLTELPVFEAEQDLYESDGVVLGEAFFRPLGGVVIVLTFTTEQDLADLAAAQAAFITEGLGSGVTLQLSGELSIGGGYYGQAAVSVTTPGLPSGGAATLTRQFTIHMTLPT